MTHKYEDYTLPQLCAVQQVLLDDLAHAQSIRDTLVVKVVEADLKQVRYEFHRRGIVTIA